MTSDVDKSNSPDQPLALVSIDDAKPDDMGGIYARKGFAFQDDVAATFLIQMIVDQNLVEVRCESNEDITNIWTNDGTRIVEFVQVKAEQPDQLWTTAKLTDRKKTKENPEGIGTSMFDKNLSWDKYEEYSIFRIVTCRQVCKELHLLTYPRGNDARSEGNAKLKDLKKQVKQKVGNYRSQKNNGTDYWISNAEWLVIDELAIIRINKHELSINLHSIGIEADPEKVTELYDTIRSLAKEKAELGIEHWKNKKITKVDLINHISKCVDPYPDSTKSERLKEKIVGSGMDDTCYEVAREQQRYYLKKKRSSQYFSSEESSDIDMKVLSVLHRLRSSLDSGEVNDNPTVFHNTCLKEVEKAGEKATITLGEVNGAYFAGCMYEITSRCRHRFRKVTK